MKAIEKAHHHRSFILRHFQGLTSIFGCSQLLMPASACASAILTATLPSYLPESAMQQGLLKELQTIELWDLKTVLNETSLLDTYIFYYLHYEKPPTSSKWIIMFNNDVLESRIRVWYFTVYSGYKFAADILILFLFILFNNDFKKRN